MDIIVLFLGGMRERIEREWRTRTGGGERREREGERVEVNQKKK
jgi:hypothetical protein